MNLLLCDWDTANFLFFSTNVFDHLVYYSHLLPLLLSTIVGLFVYFCNTKNLSNKILFFITLSFSVWTLFDLILWANEKIGYIIFFWSLQIIIEPLIYAFSLYLIFVFIEQRDTKFYQKLIVGLLLLPIIILSSTSFAISYFDFTNCEREVMEGPIVLYAYFIELIFTVYILYYGLKKYIKSVEDNSARIKNIIFTLGLFFFLLALSLGNIVGSLTLDWRLAQYGLFGMPIFMALLAYLIVKYRIFNIRVFSAQALVSALVILVGSQFFFIQNPINRILTGITLALIIVFGWWLVKSVKQEIKRREETEKLLKIQSEFLDISSHQLRTPISVIKGVSAMLVEGDMDNLSAEEKRKFYQSVYDKSLKLEKIINDILRASEFDSVKYNINDESPKISPEEVIDSAVSEAKMESEQRKIDLIWQKPSFPLPKIYCEKMYLVEAIGNLISNALKYTPSIIQVKEARNKREEKGVVRVEAKKEKDDILIKVSDNGIGIPKEEIGKLFAKFARAKNATEMYTDGSGLGLFIIKEIVNGHRGKVWLESKLGKGTTFYVSLPIAKG